MPGSVSDSYDPEFGTQERAWEVESALKGIYRRVSSVLKDQPPKYFMELLDTRVMTDDVTATLTEREWRLIRFALERAIDSV